MNYKNVKLWVGPMSQLIVDAVIEYCESTGFNIGFIPSRRQIDYHGGYVNNWTQKTFASYVYSKTTLCPILRDHGGYKQGNNEKLYPSYISFLYDTQYFDGIHIDPSKQSTNIQEFVDFTNTSITYFKQTNQMLFFEIGTEQSLFSYTPDDLYNLLLNTMIMPLNNANIQFAVIQCGTSLKDGKNTGTYDEQKLKEFVHICNNFQLASKEHNGDYQDIELVKHKFSLGLGSINIAPEIAEVYNRAVIDYCLRSSAFRQIVLTDCIESNQWRKWFTETDPYKINADLLINKCGHYVLSSSKYRQAIMPWAYEIKSCIKNYLRSFESILCLK